MCPDVTRHQQESVFVSLENLLSVLGGSVSQEQTGKLGTVAGEGHVLEQISALVTLDHLEELGELFCARLGGREVLEHSIVEHGETGHLLVDKRADNVNQTLHDRTSLARLSLEDGLEIGSGVCILGKFSDRELGTVPLAQKNGLLFLCRNTSVDIVENP
ncbi:hypothetical protein HG531_014018 [Fusarium graminearum]|nr:hypothetical protein HG531_014018 [Fusarium graminearum]